MSALDALSAKATQGTVPNPPDEEPSLKLADNDELPNSNNL